MRVASLSALLSGGEGVCSAPGDASAVAGDKLTVFVAILLNGWQLTLPTTWRGGKVSSWKDDGRAAGSRRRRQIGSPSRLAGGPYQRSAGEGATKQAPGCGASAWLRRESGWRAANGRLRKRFLLRAVAGEQVFARKRKNRSHSDSALVTSLGRAAGSRERSGPEATVSTAPGHVARRCDSWRCSERARRRHQRVARHLRASLGRETDRTAVGNRSCVR